MSLQDVLRAEKLARGIKTVELDTISRQDLSSVRSEAGCNMLFVYLLTRWAGAFESGRLSELSSDTEAFHEEVVEAYLAAGCSVDEEVAGRDLYRHTPPFFRDQVRIKDKLSPYGFVQRMLRELSAEMMPEAHEQLERLAARLERQRRASS